jgi:CBS domain containing-hemolysin-like protein
MFLLFFYLFLALLVSFLCSILEAVILSTPLSYVNVKKNAGIKSARFFEKLKLNIDRPLAAILSLNTIAHTVGAAGVGAQAANIFGEAYFGLISAVLTILILVFSEIIPKTIGATYWKQLAMVSGQIIGVIIVVMYPLVILSKVLTRILSRSGKDQTVSREEISAMANIGEEEGIFEEKENKVIQNLIRLKSFKVSDIMTPRVVVTTADESISLEEFLKNKDFLYYSRIPVYNGKPENITGYTFRRAVFEKLAEQKTNLKLKDIKRNIVAVPNTQPVLKVWETLLEKKEHMALVVDEYGGMDGIVTLEDILETILGLEIVDEKDKIVDMQVYARERWKQRKDKYNILE